MRLTFDHLLDTDGDELEVVVVARERDGTIFSEEAMDDLGSSMMAWVGTRVMRRWLSTMEPPSVMFVTLKVEVDPARVDGS